MDFMHPLAPTNEEILDALREHGSLTKTAKSFGYTLMWLRRKLKNDPELAAAAKEIREQFDYMGKPREPERESLSFKQEADTLTLVYSTDSPALGDIRRLIEQTGMDPDDWVVVSATLKKWEGMTNWRHTGKNEKMPLNAWTVTLKRKPELILATPAIHVPPVKRQRRIAPAGQPELIVVEGDHQVPYQDTGLHVASLYALDEMHRKLNLTQRVFLGDTLDLPTISAHRDHPSATASVNECLQGAYDLLRAKREAAPNARCQKLKGNHDWRLESELLGRAERMYGIKPAEVDGIPELPALHLRRLLHLDKLGVELVEHELGWQHAEVELIGGIGGLVVRHGWLTSANSAEKTLKKRGRSVIVGHTHRPEHHFLWDPSAGLMREAVTAPAMCLRRAHFAPLDLWLQGFVTVTVWPDGHFNIDHAMWDGETLHWRDRSWTP